MAQADPARLAAWHELDRAHAIVRRRVEAALQAERGLPLAWFEVLAALAAHRGRLRAGDLAEACMVRASTLTRQLDRLEAEGLVRRQRNTDDDLRAVLVVLTPEGRATLRRATTTHSRVIGKALGNHLSDADVAALARITAKVFEAD